MDEKKQILIIGAGGHAKVVLDTALLSGFQVAGVVDKELAAGQSFYGYPVLGGDDDLVALFDAGIQYAVTGIGHIGNYGLRNRIFASLKEIGYELPNVIHPSAIISPLARMGEGNVIFPGAIVNAGAVIGDHCIMNTRSVLEHDVRLGDNVHVAPGSVVLGAAVIGRDTFVGAGSVVLQERRIGERVIVGANSTVLKDVEDEQTIVGSPARRIGKQ